MIPIGKDTKNAKKIQVNRSRAHTYVKYKHINSVAKFAA